MTNIKPYVGIVTVPNCRMGIMAVKLETVLCEGSAANAGHEADSANCQNDN